MASRDSGNEGGTSDGGGVEGVMFLCVCVRERER